ncbi:hypothetical protein OPS25_09130 [Alteromonas ponticola]|uniref:Uncharacterized protein n=1 Tax=Alteromonas aquimaris TaxID=2998417 RepID=A0ABT3P7B9_9ALTE|nr:hypothetical protein [Alteromonas aquimaris]MCW8108657.1 hypothetical protein [Alteromonas aquimaris]
MQKKNGSPFVRLMQQGHSKVKYSNKKARMLMLFGDNEHRQIAALIKKWLDEDEQQK